MSLPLALASLDSLTSTLAHCALTLRILLRAKASCPTPLMIDLERELQGSNLFHPSC